MMVSFDCTRVAFYLNGTLHSQSKRLKSSHGTSYSLSMHDGLWCKFEFKGMGRGGGVQKEKVRL